LVALLLGNFMLMAFDAREADSRQRLIRVWAQATANFIQSPVATATAATNNYLESFTQMRTAVTENDLLKARIAELEIEIQKNQNVSSENERLKSLLQLKEESSYPTLSAKVIARDPSTWFDMATINRGSLDGVKLNMPVVTKDGLAGRVVATSPITAQFILLSDDKSAAAAVVGQLGTSTALGVLRGSGEKGVLEMRYVPGYEVVNVGEMVSTSGQDGIYPAGLKIGEIIDVRSGSATIPHMIYIKSSVRIGSLQDVAVLMYQPPARPRAEQALPNVKIDNEPQKPQR
jgi:rod shape-determining protein MreC